MTFDRAMRLAVLLVKASLFLLVPGSLPLGLVILVWRKVR